MTYTRADHLSSLIALVAGTPSGAASCAIVAGWVMLADCLGMGQLARIVIIPAGLLLGVLGWSLLLTALLPRASNASLSLACVVPSVLVAFLVIPVSWLRAGVFEIVALTVPSLAGYLGMRLGRWLWPFRQLRCHWPVPGEPRCPRCGYVLYYAKRQKCPDCGRRFTQLDVDMRRARWDGYILRPWP